MMLKGKRSFTELSQPSSSTPLLPEIDTATATLMLPVPVLASRPYPTAFDGNVEYQLKDNTTAKGNGKGKIPKERSHIFGTTKSTLLRRQKSEHSLLPQQLRERNRTVLTSTAAPSNNIWTFWQGALSSAAKKKGARKEDYRTTFGPRAREGMMMTGKEKNRERRVSINTWLKEGKGEDDEGGSWSE
ncbi:hypothetical protein MKZ38_009329 [Zalerion maritima]|uniref:Uncharacterized protein n=1 Tax=Zalerion maritima TaxID=339359 RepID=A0AAD5RGF7_9PEZI|nr:hypothetical protein MKZ38_009329 [Zalerion maritima]